MEIVSFVLIGIGFIISVIYGIKLLILAFQKSVLWGLGSIFIPFVGLVFVIMHWAEAKGPFLKSLLAIPFFIGGIALGAGSLPQQSAY
ncbi:hypothetical protein [Verrucomicrobium spinosum]|uniref:hypothetical protein n=1 Tax=Verrucomicrobium spinosum TaxID=2736 RepID=UPI000174564B|nr:hypothetical protein [Verrucomicrobium spinosum]